MDLQSGDFVFFPGSVSGWTVGDPKLKAAEYRLGSSLIVLSGQVIRRARSARTTFSFLISSSGISGPS